MNDWLKRLDPAIPGIWLLILAGVVWNLIAFMLCFWAVFWLENQPIVHSAFFFSPGIILALAMYRTIFRKIVKKNAERLSQVIDKRCLFAFQTWRSYFLIVFMIILGYLLRHSAIPKEYLSMIYLIIGGALFLGSIQYYRYIWRNRSSGRIL